MVWSRFWDMPIRKKLNLFFTALVVIPLITFTFLVSAVIQNTLFSQVEKRSLQSLRQSMQGIENSLSELDSIMVTNLRGKEIQSILIHVQTNVSSPEEKNTVRRILRNIAYTRKDILCLVLTTDSGERFVFPENEAYDKVREYVFRKTPVWDGAYAERFRRGETLWQGLPEDASCVMGIRKIRDFETLDELGCLYLFLDEATIRRQYENMKMTPGSFFAVQDLEGRIVSRNGDPAKGGEDEDADRVLYITRLKNKELGWTIQAYVPKKEMLVVIRRVQILFASMLCVILGILLLLMRRFSISITEPVRNLQAKMLEVRNGNFDVTAAVEHQDEMGELAVTFNTMTGQIKELIEKEYQSRLLLQETEYKFLRAQINPHMLYNTLDSISWMAAMGKGKEVSRMSVALGRILRWSISNTDNVVLLREEVHIVEDYLYIQKFRYGENLFSRIEIKEPEASQYVPKMILQPLVENALIHGLSEKEGECCVEIEADTAGAVLEIRIRDNGTGMSKDKIREIMEGKICQKKSYGVGLYNVHQRICLRYGENYGIHIESQTGNGTCVYIRIPARGEEQNENTSDDCGR